MCFVCFCVFSSQQILAHNYPCVLRVFVFFFQTNFRSQPMCFACFFVINKYLSSTSSQGRHPMCFMCFCVFIANRSQATTHVFYVFLCFFLIQNYQKRFSRTRQNATLVFYVFLCFSSKNFRSQPVCFVCFCVFSKQNLGHNPCVLRVSVIFFMYKYKGLLQVRADAQCVLCVFVFFLRSPGISFMYFMCFCVFIPNRSQATTDVFYVFLCFLL